jgi:hypothetical protein
VLPTIYIKKASLSLVRRFATPNEEISPGRGVRRVSLREQPQMNADPLARVSPTQIVADEVETERANLGFKPHVSFVSEKETGHDNDEPAR